MKAIKVKVIGSDKLYWLTPRQARGLVENLKKDKNALLTLGGSMVKGSAIKSFEDVEVVLNDMPEYYKEALKKENAGALPMPKSEVVKITKRYDTLGNEMRGTYRKLIENGLRQLVEKDYEVINGELGRVVEERLIEFETYYDGYSPVIKSIKRASDLDK
jgi:hypothetical protein